MKKPYAYCMFFLGLIGVGMIAASIGTETWACMKIRRENYVSPNETTTGVTTLAPGSGNCTIERCMGLFTGNDVIPSCALILQYSGFSMLTTDYLVYDVGLQYAVIVAAFLVIITGLLIIGVAAYNIFSRPYENFADPSALIAYYSTAAALTLVTLILYVVIFFVEYKDSLPPSCDGDIKICMDFSWVIDSMDLQYSFFILVGACAPFLLGVMTAVLAMKDVTKTIKKRFYPQEQQGKEDIIMF